MSETEVQGLHGSGQEGDQMPKETVFTAPRMVDFREDPERDPGPRELKLKTLFSGISHGTEMNIYRGTSPQFKKAMVDGLFEEGAPAYSYPMTYGYEEVGEVVAVGSQVREYKVGDLVASAYGHREIGYVDIDRNPFTQPVPQGLEPLEAIFHALGTVALDGLFTSGLRLGEGTVIFGMGIVGILTLQVCKAAGVAPIVAVDLLPSRLEMAKRLGADHAFDARKPGLAREIRSILGGRGADAVFETSGSIQALHESIRCAAPLYSRVVAVAWYQGAAEGLFLGEEFHHTTGASEIVAVNQFRRGSMASLRWDGKRIHAAVMRLLATRRMGGKDLVSHVIPFARMREAFELIDGRPQEVLKVVLEF